MLEVLKKTSLCIDYASENYMHELPPENQALNPDHADSHKHQVYLGS